MSVGSLSARALAELSNKAINGTAVALVTDADQALCIGPIRWVRVECDTAGVVLAFGGTGLTLTNGAYALAGIGQLDIPCYGPLFGILRSGAGPVTIRVTAALG